MQYFFDLFLYAIYRANYNLFETHVIFDPIILGRYNKYYKKKIV